MLSAQQVSAQDRYYRSGFEFFKKGLYREALREFSNDVNASNNRELILKRMISYYEINDLKAAKKDISTLLAFKKKDDQLYLYIGKIYHAELNFAKAIEYYKLYLRRTPQNDDLRKQVISDIKRCASGLNLLHFDQLAFIENMGSKVNTIYDEIDPVQSPNNLDKYYFSSNRALAEGGRRNAEGLKDNVFGEHSLDMFATELKNGKWSEVESLNTLLNTAKHERVLGFNSDGSILFFLKGESREKATIYVDTFAVNADEIYPPKFESPLIGQKGDVYLQFYNDSTIIFSSRRKGGFGGYDLYVCYKRGKYWSSAKNLGPNVNGPFDEVSPFLTRDGMTLYYSSNRLESMGGHDVFMSSYSLQIDDWMTPENLKIGINSGMDDLFYRVSADGQSAYFSSNRKTGLGKNDLYKAFLKKQETGQLGYNPDLPFIANDKMVKDLAVNKKTAVKSPNEKIIASGQEEFKPKQFVIEPLYFTKEEQLFTLANEKNINNIIDIMNIYPTTRIEIESHSVTESQIAYELYFSIKRAEKIADFLIEKGISERRIMLRGHGSNYPLVALDKQSQAGTLADKLNRRLEIKINGTEDLPLDITYAKPIVADFLKGNSGELYETANMGLSYRIFIANVNQMYQNDILNYYQDVMIEREYGKRSYLYTLGLFKNYSDAQKVLLELKKDDISEARILPYINGKQLDTKKMMDFASQYPDLVNYLQYNGQ